jgi:hypothetical protein
MTTSATAIWAICAVVVAGLAFWLVTVALAARKPSQEHAHGEQLRGRVQGGMHVGGGRSVAPRRDEPVTPGETVAGNTLHPDAADEDDTGQSGRARQGSGNPMDL